MKSSFINLIRPRTLLLSIIVITAANMFSFHIQGTIDNLIYILSLTSALTLQIVANIANDYGDGIRGTDNHRKDRIYAQNKLTHQQIKYALLIAILFSVLSCGALIFYSKTYSFLFVTIGGLLAALCYTLGRFPFAYNAMGEIIVFLFFGFAAIIFGSYLQLGYFHKLLIVPALMNGLLSVAVLHINNIRDIDSDLLFNKITIANKLGYQKSILLLRIYYALALILKCFTICEFGGSFLSINLITTLYGLMMIFDNAFTIKKSIQMAIIFNIIILS